MHDNVHSQNVLAVRSIHDNILYHGNAVGSGAERFEMQWVWTWKGSCFGYREDDDLWTYDGRHVGQFHKEEVYGRDGRYLGELMSEDRLITQKAKLSSRRGSFAPYSRRAAYARYAAYAGYAMYAGYEDFPLLESFT